MSVPEPLPATYVFSARVREGADLQHLLKGEKGHHSDFKLPTRHPRGQSRGCRSTRVVVPTDAARL